MKRVASFLLAVLLCFLEGCGLTDTQDIESSEGNSVPWTTNSPNEGTGSLEQENYILQHLDYLEGDECRKVLSVKGDLAGQASKAYEESNHAKINKLWTTISDVCMLVGKNEIEMDNEYDVLLTDLMQSTASEENFEESYVEAYCAAVKELLSGLSGIMKNEEDAFKLLSGSAVNKVADLTESIDHWLYVLQEAEGKDKKNILPLYDSVLKNLKKSYDEALGSKGKEFLSNAKEIMNYVCDIADLTSDSFSDLVDEYLFYRATSEAAEEWYMTWKQIAEEVGKDDSDEAKRVYESLSGILSEIEKGKNEGWEQVYADSAKRSTWENLTEYNIKTSLSVFKQLLSKWEIGKEAQIIFSSFSTGISLANRLMNCDDIAYYGQMVLGTGILARNTFSILLSSVNDSNEKKDYESALHFDQVFHIYKDLQLKGCDFAIAFHQAIIENPVGYTLKYISDEHVAVSYNILVTKSDWLGYECHGKITDQVIVAAEREQIRGDLYETLIVWPVVYLPQNTEIAEKINENTELTNLLKNARTIIASMPEYVVPELGITMSYTFQPYMVYSTAGALSIGFSEFGYYGGVYSIEELSFFISVDDLLDPNVPEAKSKLNGFITEGLQKYENEGALLSPVDKVVSLALDGSYANCWSLTVDGLQLLFSPGEVSTYAAGYVTVTVPYSKLYGIFAEKYMPADHSGLAANAVTYIELAEETDDYLNIYGTSSDYALVTSGDALDVYFGEAVDSGQEVYATNVMFYANIMTKEDCFEIGETDDDMFLMQYTFKKETELTGEVHSELVKIRDGEVAVDPQ